MDKDTLYFNIKNTYLRIFGIIVINLQIAECLLSIVSFWFKSTGSLGKHS